MKESVRSSQNFNISNSDKTKLKGHNVLLLIKVTYSFGILLVFAGGGAWPKINTTYNHTSFQKNLIQFNRINSFMTFQGSIF